MSNIDSTLLGPLAHLAGEWEGTKGDDTAPSPERTTEKNFFRERMFFEPFGPVDNHEQKLYGLRYKTTAWRHGEEDSFHEEVGYWLWDAKAKQMMRCFMVPRGVTLIAGGKVQPQAKEFTLKAELGSKTYGILSNLFLHEEFRTVKYVLKIKCIDNNSFSYDEDTVLKMKGKKSLFHHRDKNLMSRIRQ